MENIVLDADGNAKLVDFGAAREGGTDQLPDVNAGHSGIHGARDCESKGAQGRAGGHLPGVVLLFNLVSGGAFPFWGRNMDDLRRNIMAQPLKLPSHLTPAAKDLITKLLQKSSAIRMTIHDVRKHAFKGGDAEPWRGGR